MRTDLTEEINLNLQVFHNVILKNDLPKLYELIRNETDVREQQDNGLVKKVGEEMQRIEEVLRQDKSQREDNENVIERQ